MMRAKLSKFSFGSSASAPCFDRHMSVVITERKNEILHSIWRNAFAADAHPVSGDLQWARQPEEAKLRLRIEWVQVPSQSE